MTDNFDILEQYMRDNGIPQHNNYGLSKHYVVEIVSRGKDNPDMPAANRHFKNYYFPCIDKFIKYKPEIKTVCDSLRMRAYFSVNYKLYDEILKNMVVEAASRVATNDFGKPYNIYSHCSGLFRKSSDRKYIVDVDEEQMDHLFYYSQLIGDKVILSLPTRTGRHLITKPFNVTEFTKRIISDFDKDAVPEIKKNGLTLLYENL